ncbi:hypothetical protein PR048_022369 [Dryococelus australis]|uniref:Reverse transcriptase n=1 Tax=Dryococelus australis TaxID=614101 RepID=A0ABQ9H0V3_9NEOP|nr:hypothetical protein PR048_022369 [Dryococelus australis]
MRNSLYYYGIRLNFTVLYALEPASFLHWLLHRCEDTPSVTQLHVIGAHDCEVFPYWRRVTQGVSHKLWSSDKRIAKYSALAVDSVVRTLASPPLGSPVISQAPADAILRARVLVLGIMADNGTGKVFSQSSRFLVCLQSTSIPLHLTHSFGWPGMRANYKTAPHDEPSTNQPAPVQGMDAVKRSRRTLYKMSAVNQARGDNGVRHEQCSGGGGGHTREGKGRVTRTKVEDGQRKGRPGGFAISVTDKERTQLEGCVLVGRLYRTARCSLRTQDQASCSTGDVDGKIRGQTLPSSCVKTRGAVALASFPGLFPATLRESPHLHTSTSLTPPSYIICRPPGSATNRHYSHFAHTYTAGSTFKLFLRLMQRKLNQQFTVDVDVLFLGVIVDEKMSFRKHMEYVARKAVVVFRKLKSIGNASWGLNFRTLGVIQKAVFEAIISYGTIAWHNRAALVWRKKKLTSAQKAALLVVAKE